MREIESVRAIPKEHIGGGVDCRRTVLQPDPAMHDPFILWGEDWFRRGAFDWHGHRGFATVTYVHEGQMETANSLGESGILDAGDVQWTTAGAGLLHDGQPVGDAVVHGMQLWVNLPAKLKKSLPGETTIRGQHATEIGDDAFRGRLFMGQCNGFRGPFSPLVDMVFLEMRFQSGTQTVDVDDAHVGYVYVLRGKLRVNGHDVAAGEVARLAGLGSIACTAIQSGVAIFISGKPIQEKVVIDGPFVMNTKEEIATAYNDLKEGRMGEVPAFASIAG